MWSFNSKLVIFTIKVIALPLKVMSIIRIRINNNINNEFHVYARAHNSQAHNSLVHLIAIVYVIRSMHCYGKITCWEACVISFKQVLGLTIEAKQFSHGEN